MGAFIGPLGGLIEATQWQEKQSVSTGAAPSFFTGMDGSRTAFVQPRVGRVLRSWGVAMTDADPQRAAAFQSLALGAFGPGPFLFIDPMAQVTNVLTPRVSMLAPGTLPSLTAPSLARVEGLGMMPAASTNPGASVKFAPGAPVVPGRAVTVSAWVSSPEPVIVTAQFLTAAGSASGSDSASFTDMSGGGWVSVTAVPKDYDAQVEIRIRSVGACTVSCLAVTWTKTRFDWSPGRGAAQVVVSDLQESYANADPHVGGQRWIDYSATVTEVGSGA